MADYAQLMNLEKKPKAQKPSSDEKKHPQPQATHLSSSQSIGRSTMRLTQQSTIQSGNKIVEKPKGFYITERLNKQLDEAVRYFQEVHGIKKADRSTIVNAILDNEANWTEEALDLLVDRVISLLTSRLMG